MYKHTLRCPLTLDSVLCVCGPTNVQWSHHSAMSPLSRLQSLRIPIYADVRNSDDVTPSQGEPSLNGNGNGQWPAVSSSWGVHDLVGFKKDAAFGWQAWWTSAHTAPMVHLVPGNWNAPPPGQNQTMMVWAYSNCDVVELLLNGRSLGTKQVPRNSHVEWAGVSWEPGTLTAMASINNKVVGGTATLAAPAAEDSVTTSTEPARLHITLDWPGGHGSDGSGGATLVADGIDTALVRVEVQDAHHVCVPTASNTVTFSVVGHGAAVIGVGNGDPSSHERDKATHRRAFNGLVRAVVQTALWNQTAAVAGGGGGGGATAAAKIVVVATSPGLASNSLTITVLPPSPTTANKRG